MAKIIKKKDDGEEKRTEEDILEEIEENKMSNVAREPKEKKVKKPFNFNEKAVWIGIGVFFLIAALVISALGLTGYYLNSERIKGTQGKIGELQDISRGMIEIDKKALEEIKTIKKIQKADQVKAAGDKEELLAEIGKTNEDLQKKEDKFVPPEIPVGFTPDENLIDVSKEVVLPEIPKDIKPYRIFPDVKGIWGKPLAGYNFGYNDAFRDSNRIGNIQIPTWSWVVCTGEEIFLPGIGSLKDKDGGAVLAVTINVWETPGEFLLGYILHGFWGTGEVWDMSDMTDNADYTNPQYGESTLKTLAVLRNHYINQLGSDEPNPEFRGQTGKGTQAETITWVVVLRWYDGSFRLVNSGQWIRGQ